MLHKDDRPNRYGSGTAIAVKTSTSHYRVVLPPLANVEATAFELPGFLGGLLLVSAYKPLGSVLLDADLSSVFHAHRRVILAGDINWKHPAWGSRLSSGRALQRYANSQNIRTIGPADPKYYPHRRGAHPDVLDIALAKGLVWPVEVYTVSELSSDHIPILVHVATQHDRF